MYLWWNKDRQNNIWMLGLPEWQIMDRWIDGKNDRWTDRQMDGKNDRWTNGVTNGWINRMMDGWKGGQMDGWGDRVGVQMYKNTSSLILQLTQNNFFNLCPYRIISCMHRSSTVRFRETFRHSSLSHCLVSWETTAAVILPPGKFDMSRYSKFFIWN